MITIYEISIFGEKHRFEADLSEASAPIYTLDDQGNALSTPYQTADCGHSMMDVAVTLIYDWGDSVWATDAEHGEREDGTSTYDGMTAEEYIAEQIDSVQAIA